MLRITKAIKNADLEVCLFKSQKLDKVFMKIRASLDRLRDEADRIDYQLLLDENEVKERIQGGVKVRRTPPPKLAPNRRNATTPSHHTVCVPRRIL